MVTVNANAPVIAVPDTITDHAQWCDYVDKLSDNEVQLIANASYWNYSSPSGVPTDEDGFDIGGSTVTQINLSNFGNIQKACWEKFNDSPQINSHVRDQMGLMTGYGFEVNSPIPEIQEVLSLIGDDVRNEHYKFIPKWVARAEIQGELFLALTVHPDGFVETDFMNPSGLSGGGEANSGIYFHPRKQTMPMIYEFTITSVKNSGSVSECLLYPSMYAAYYPELLEETILANKANLSSKKWAGENAGVKYAEIGNKQTFIIAWDRGFITPRNLSHIKTTVKWVNHYEDLKKWEIDHKKSSGAYLWCVKMIDMRAYKNWMKMTPEQKKETGLYAPKTPGGTLFLPPGVEIECKNPSLSSISEQDTDIMHMVTSGLNKPEDMVTGQTKGDTFSGIKASRGPQADRNADEIAYFERFLRYDLWRGIFFLRSKVLPSFKLEYKVEEATDFKDQEPVIKKVKKQAHDLIFFVFPTSEISDLQNKASAYLGVSHASIAETLGIPRSDIAAKLGFNNYRSHRLRYAQEDKEYPELPLNVAILSAQESSNGLTPGGGSPLDNKNKAKPEEPTTPAKEKTKVKPTLNPRKK